MFFCICFPDWNFGKWHSKPRGISHVTFQQWKHIKVRNPHDSILSCMRTGHETLNNILECLPGQAIERHMRELGYDFVWANLDTQHFLLPQRRNRTWGVASLMSSSHDKDALGEVFSDMLSAMKSNWHFPEELFWEQGLPREPAKNQREQQLLERAKAAFPGMNNVFFDTSSSLDRPVHCAGAVPCITPSHGIYSTNLERYLTTKDILNAQGFFESLFSPEGYQFLLDNPVLAQDMAGNAFSTTVCQAVFLSTLAAAPHIWESVGVTRQEDAPAQHPAQQADAPLRRLKGKQSAPSYGPALTRGWKRSFAAVQGSDREKKPRRKNNKDRKSKYKRKKQNVDSRKFSRGKRVEATLWEKEAVMAAYEKAKKDASIKHPMKHVAGLGLKGFYRCCVYKWAKARASQQWSLLCSAAPKLCQKYKEVPDSLRKLVGAKLKFQTRASAKGQGSTVLPAALISTVSDYVVPLLIFLEVDVDRMPQPVRMMLFVQLAHIFGRRHFDQIPYIYIIYIYIHIL